MNLRFDPLREAILVQLNRAISVRRAQGASFEALGMEFGLSKEALHLIAGYDEQAAAKCAASTRSQRRPSSRLLEH